MPRLASNSARRGPTLLRYITSVAGVMRMLSLYHRAAADRWCLSLSRNVPSPSPATGRGTERPLQNHLMSAAVVLVEADRSWGGHLVVLFLSKLKHYLPVPRLAIARRMRKDGMRIHSAAEPQPNSTSP